MHDFFEYIIKKHETYVNEIYVNKIEITLHLIVKEGIILNF